MFRICKNDIFSDIKHEHEHKPMPKNREIANAQRDNKGQSLLKGPLLNGAKAGAKGKRISNDDL